MLGRLGVHLILKMITLSSKNSREWFTPKARARLGKILRLILHTAGQDVMNVFT